MQSLHVLQGCLSFQQECRSAREGGEGRGLHRCSGLRSTGRGTCLGSVATGGGGGTACTGPAGMTATLKAASPPQGDNRYGGEVKLPTRRIQRNGKMAATQRKAAEAREHTSGPAPRPWRTSYSAARAQRRATRCHGSSLGALLRVSRDPGSRRRPGGSSVSRPDTELRLRRRRQVS